MMQSPNISLFTLLALAPMLTACTQTAAVPGGPGGLTMGTPGGYGVMGGGITGMDPLGPFAPSAGVTALGIAATATGNGALASAAGMAHKAEVEARVAILKEQLKLPDPHAMIAHAEAAKQRAIQSGMMNPDGTMREPPPSDFGDQEAEPAAPKTKPKRAQSR